LRRSLPNAEFADSDLSGSDDDRRPLLPQLDPLGCRFDFLLPFNVSHLVLSLIAVGSDDATSLKLFTVQKHAIQIFELTDLKYPSVKPASFLRKNPLKWEIRCHLPNRIFTERPPRSHPRLHFRSQPIMTNARFPNLGSPRLQSLQCRRWAILAIIIPLLSNKPANILRLPSLRQPPFCIDRNLVALFPQVRLKRVFSLSQLLFRTKLICFGGCAQFKTIISTSSAAAATFLFGSGNQATNYGSY